MLGLALGICHLDIIKIVISKMANIRHTLADNKTEKKKEIAFWFYWSRGRIAIAIQQK